jgi:hypothetical protein
MPKETDMSDRNKQESFTATHHALLYGWISRAVVELVGEQKGEAVMRKAARQYGEERGRRMALRAKANGHPLSMINYIAYMEWKASPGEMKRKVVESSPHAKVYVHECPWYIAWEKKGMIPYGRFFCLEIDKALVSGFNPELRLDVNGTRTNGSAQCEFVFHDANLRILNYVLLGYRKVVKPGKKALMPWEYHIGHLFKTVEKVVVDDLGDVGYRAANAALVEFAKQYGEQAAQKVMEHRNTDFDCLPE